MSRRLSGHWSWRDYAIDRSSRLYVVLIPALLLGWVWDKVGSSIFASTGLSTALGGIRHCHRTEPGYAGTFLGNLLFLQTIVCPTLDRRTVVEFGQQILVLHFFSRSVGRSNGLESEFDTPRDLTYGSRDFLGDLPGTGNIAGIPDLVGGSCSGAGLFQLRFLGKGTVDSHFLSLRSCCRRVWEQREPGIQKCSEATLGWESRSVCFFSVSFRWTLEPDVGSTHELRTRSPDSRTVCMCCIFPSCFCFGRGWCRHRDGSRIWRFWVTA